MSSPEPRHPGYRTLVDSLEPGADLIDFTSPPGGFSNSTRVVRLRTRAGSELALVVRTYAASDYDPPAARARREHDVLTGLQAHGVPAPRPLLLDVDGVHLGVPTLVTSYLVGRHRVDQRRPHQWASATAATLARIHAVPCSAAGEHLMNGRYEATWFARPDAAPPFLAASAVGEHVWSAAREALGGARPVAPVLVHLDYWAGNLLWKGDEVAAVLDWEEASCGDPGIDVAYARLELCLLGVPEAADTFLATYEAEAGRQVHHLGLWELAAAARALPDPAGWVAEWVELGAVSCNDAEAWARLERFVDEAARRSG